MVPEQNNVWCPPSNEHLEWGEAPGIIVLTLRMRKQGFRKLNWGIEYWISHNCASRGIHQLKIYVRNPLTRWWWCGIWVCSIGKLHEWWWSEIQWPSFKKVSQTWLIRNGVVEEKGGHKNIFLLWKIVEMEDVQNLGRVSYTKCKDAFDQTLIH